MRVKRLHEIRWKEENLGLEFGLQFHAFLLEKYPLIRSIEDRCKRFSKELKIPGQWEILVRLASNTKASSPHSLETLLAAVKQNGLSETELTAMGLTAALKSLKANNLELLADHGYRQLPTGLYEAVKMQKDRFARAEKLSLTVLNGDYVRNVRLILQKRTKVRLPSQITYAEDEPTADRRIAEELEGPNPFRNLREIELFMPTAEHYSAWLKLSGRWGKYESYRAARKFWVALLRELRDGSPSTEQVIVSIYICPLIPEICYFVDYGDWDGFVLGTHLLFGMRPGDWPSYEIRGTGIGRRRLNLLADAQNKLRQPEWQLDIDSEN